MESLPDETSKRFVAVLNEKIETGRLLNALGHMTAGLTRSVGEAELMCFLEYRDSEGGIHPNISHFPFIVLKAENSNQIRKVRNEVIAQRIPYTDFTSTMTVGSSAEQRAATAASKELDLEYFGLCMFGSTETLRALTKKFSLFR